MSDETRNTAPEEAPTAGPIYDPPIDREHMPSRYAPAEVETWLEDKAAEGWHLTKFTSNFLHYAGQFEKGEPARCRYRLTALPKKEKEPGEEYRALCEDCGWRYVTTMYGTFHLWRCDDATAPEIEMDPEVQAEGFRYVHRRLIWEVVQNFLLSLLLLGWFWFLLHSDGRGTPLLFLFEEGRPWCIPASALMLALGIGESIWGLRRVERIIRRLRAGVPLNRPAPYKPLRRRTRLLWLAVVVCYSYVVLFSGFFADTKRINEEDAETMAPVRYVDAAVLEPEREVYLWDAKTKSMEGLSRMYYVTQAISGGGPGAYNYNCDSTYFRLWTQGLAKRLTQELRLKFYEYYYDWDEPLPPAEPGPLDEFYWNGTVGDQQFALARLENRVVCVDYRGGADLREHTAYLAEMLAE